MTRLSTQPFGINDDAPAGIPVPAIRVSPPARRSTSFVPMIAPGPGLQSVGSPEPKLQTMFFWRSTSTTRGADLLPAFDTEISEVPATTNPLGMRGGSERGITPGLAAVANAIVDALAEFGVEHIELPATPERVWNAIRATRQDGAERRESGRPNRNPLNPIPAR